MAPGKAASAAAQTTGEPEVVDQPGFSPARTVVAAGLSDSALSVDELLGLVTGPSVGGVGLFVGIVRDVDHGQPVLSLDYTAHPSAADELARCAAEVAARYDVEMVAVRHRIGHLELGDLAVVVAVGARHRAPALEACRELIDQLKQQVPVWKEQRFGDGSVEWVGL